MAALEESVIALAIVLAGLFLLMVAPAFQGWLGNGRRELVTMAGLVLVVLGAAVSLWVERVITPASLLALVVLAWGVLVYLVVRIRRAWARPPGVPRAVEHCVSKLTEGQFTQVPGAPTYVATSNSTFSALMYSFSCDPTNSSLKEHLWAYGDDYYVFCAFFYKVEIDRTINLKCKVKRARCVINNPVSIVGGPSEMKDRSLMGKIAEDIEYYDDRLVIVVTMGAALSASKVTLSGRATKSGVSGSVNIQFPDASKASPSAELGSYEWECAAFEATGTSSGGAGSGATSGTGVIGGATGPEQPGAVRETCANTHPDALDCVDDLDDDFVYDSLEELREAAEDAAGEPVLRTESQVQDDRGPCPGIGEHYDFYGASNKHLGSGFSCPCCEDTENGPVMTTKYKYNG